MNRTMDDLEKDILMLAEAVGVMTIPDPKPRTLADHVNHAANVAYDAITDFEENARNWWVNRSAARTPRYVGRHRLTTRRRILRRLMNAGTRLDLRVLATLESVGRPPQDVQKALANIRDTADRARRDISFYHTYLNGMTDIGERGVKC